MDNICHTESPMPDVATQAHPRRDEKIDWAGMEGIRMPILFDGGDGEVQRSCASVDAFVNLIRPGQRGIHMSRLYLLLDRHLGTNPLDAPTLESLLHAFLLSQHGLSDRAHTSIRFEHLVRRQALLSRHHGWRAYPVQIEATLGKEGFNLELGTQIVYSSTCPASAALSRQLIQQQFARDFPPGVGLDQAAVMRWLGGEDGIIATPHAQRSISRLRVRLADGAALNLIDLLDRVEQSLGTAVQTAVKREDEQAFSRANGTNLMFCEDAARRIRHILDSDAAIADFHVRIEHHESLHAHDAVAYASKGAPAVILNI